MMFVKSKLGNLSIPVEAQSLPPQLQTPAVLRQTKNIQTPVSIKSLQYPKITSVGNGLKDII